MRNNNAAKHQKIRTTVLPIPTLRELSDGLLNSRRIYLQDRCTKGAHGREGSNEETKVFHRVES